MKSTSAFKALSVLITSLVLIICSPQAFARGGGHGGGGFGGGGFHGGGGGFHAGGAGWHGGYGGWRGGGYGWRGHGWGCCGWGGWGPGWGWGFGVGFGWGWGSYWGSYPYAYGYPYYYPYYPYYPYPPYSYDGPYAGSRQAPDPYNENHAGNTQQNFSIPDRSNDDPARLVTAKATTPRPPASSRPVVASNAGPGYRTASSTTQQLARLRPQARNVMQALLAMPPEARRRQVESGRYSNFSPEEQELFRKAAQLPPASSAPDKSGGRAKGQVQLAAERIQ